MYFLCLLIDSFSAVSRTLFLNRIFNYLDRSSWNSSGWCFASPVSAGGSPSAAPNNLNILHLLWRVKVWRQNTICKNAHMPKDLRISRTHRAGMMLHTSAANHGADLLPASLPPPKGSQPHAICPLPCLPLSSTFINNSLCIYILIYP